MTRTLFYPLTILVALATGLTLLGIAITLTHDPIVTSGTTTDTVSAVNRFYAAAADVLRTGDATPLHAAVASGYRESTALTATPTGITGFIQFLTAVGAACPDCRLEVEHLSMGTDEAAVRVDIHGHQQGTVQGVAGDGVEIAWSALDVLWVVEGHVAERWSHSDPLSLGEPLVTEVSVAVPPGVDTLQVVRRLVLVGARVIPVAGTGPTMLVVESGTLVVQTIRADQRGIDPATSGGNRVLEPGERLLIAPGVQPTIRNDGPTSATLLVISMTNTTAEVIDRHDPP